MSQIWEREDIEESPAKEFPSVRCRVEVAYVDQDGRREKRTKDTSGKIVLDDSDPNRPWVCCSMGSKQLSFQLSWDLLLQILNDPYTPPLWVNQDNPVELEV